MQDQAGAEEAGELLSYRILQGDVLERLQDLDDESVHCVVTSPPYYGLRDYQVEGQIGAEEHPEQYLVKLVSVFSEVKRVLRSDGTLWLNIGDSYAGSWGARGRSDSTNAPRPDLESKYGIDSPARNGFPSLNVKPKDLIGMPWRIAFALQADGWYLRSDIIWAKPNGMPGSQQDRPTSSHEHVFLLSKQQKYWTDFDAIKTPPRESTLLRTMQDVQAQAGSHRANGGAKTNGTMKAVGGVDKQRGHSRRHAGFNERWDAMTVKEQQSTPAMIRDVWIIPPACYKEAHFAVMPEELARRCILAGCPRDGVVLDPFNGAGTTGVVATRLNREYVGIELNPEYREMALRRIREDNPMFNVEVAG